MIFRSTPFVHQGLDLRGAFRAACLSKLLSSSVVLGLSTGLGLSFPQLSQAGGVIFNNTNPSLASLALGINNEGHLNFVDPLFSPVNSEATGLSFRFADGSFRDATSPGCFCEGWGVAATDSLGNRVAGWANVFVGSGGLTGGVFGSTNTTASSFTGLSDASLGIQHFYGVSLAPDVFQGNVTITNNGTEEIRDVVYRRVMDWDVPPTEFSDYVSHFGVVSNLESVGGNVRFAGDNGFASSDPRTLPTEIVAGTTNTDFFQSGPADHGSVFDFAFGNLTPGESRTFNIFYGASSNLAAAQSAITQLNPEVWSLGQSDSGGTPANDQPTFLFAFRGVGGDEPGSSPANPILPFVPAPGEFIFPAPQPRRWFDPPLVSSFDYSLVGGSFLSFILPPGYSGLDLVVGGTTFADLISDGVKEYFFSTDFGLSGITEFTIADISPLVDAADPTAFPTFLDFTPGATSLTMKAGGGGGGGGTSSVPAPLPLLSGAAFLGSLRKLRTLSSRLKVG